MESYIGSSGYFYWHWKEVFYPKKLSTHKWFDYHAKNFNTVEINASFYQWPKEITINAWKNKAKNLETKGKKFLFSSKANKQITHIKKLNGIKKIVRDFYKLVSLLKPYLESILFQLPPSLKFDKKKLKNFIEYLDNKFINVIEFRHKHWWNQENYDMLKDGTVFCIVSSPSLPEDFIKTNDTIYIKFHGKQKLYRSNYSDKEPKEWAKKIKKGKSGVVYAYFNNDFNAYAAKNALKLI